MFSKLVRDQLPLVGPVALWAFCGSTLATHIGLRGFDQWPVTGFAAGLVLTSVLSVYPLAKKVRELQSRIEVIEKK